MGTVTNYFKVLGRRKRGTLGTFVFFDDTDPEDVTRAFLVANALANVTPNGRLCIWRSCPITVDGCQPAAIAEVGFPVNPFPSAAA